MVFIIGKISIKQVEQIKWNKKIKQYLNYILMIKYRNIQAILPNDILKSEK